MSTPSTLNPKIYHIVHLDRLASILEQGFLWSDALVQAKGLAGTMIGMPHIKQRRMTNALQSHPGLTVGECVPFYFCPRSIMLFILSRKSHIDISYRGGQEPIIHFQADLEKVIRWATENQKRWAFTDSNAGSFYYNDYCSLNQLNQIDWNAVNAASWSDCKDKKQAEFLLEDQFPWSLVDSIGVHSQAEYQQVSTILSTTPSRPALRIEPSWYY